MMTLRLAGEPVTLNAVEPAAVQADRSSLQLPLDPLAGAGPGSVVVFYARDVDAFTVVAADTGACTGSTVRSCSTGTCPAQDPTPW